MPSFVLPSKTTQINEEISGNKFFDPLDPINNCCCFVVLLRKTKEVKQNMHNIYLPPFVLRSKTTQINEEISGNKFFDPLDPINDCATVVLRIQTIAIFICLLLFYYVKQHKSMIRSFGSNNYCATVVLRIQTIAINDLCCFTE